MQTKMPEGYNQVMPYLILHNAAGFIDFMQQVFGATEHSRHMTEENTIMHAEIEVGDSVIMIGEASALYPPSPSGMFIYVPDADEAYARAIAAGSLSILPIEDKPYGRTGGVTDPFGNTWWVTTHSL